jgi:CheY-like chemotaxis protein
VRTSDPAPNTPPGSQNWFFAPGMVGEGTFFFGYHSIPRDPNDPEDSVTRQSPGARTGFVKELCWHGNCFDKHFMSLASGEAAIEKFVAEETVPSAVSRAERVLLIDDNGDITDLFSTFLELSGFDVQTAHDGPSALRLAAAYKPTVAVLDLGLPVMDGYELAAKLVEQLGSSAP